MRGGSKRPTFCFQFCSLVTGASEKKRDGGTMAALLMSHMNHSRGEQTLFSASFFTFTIVLRSRGRLFRRLHSAAVSSRAYHAPREIGRRRADGLGCRLTSVARQVVAQAKKAKNMIFRVLQTMPRILWDEKSYKQQMRIKKGSQFILFHEKNECFSPVARICATVTHRSVYFLIGRATNSTLFVARPKSTGSLRDKTLSSDEILAR